MVKSILLSSSLVISFITGIWGGSSLFEEKTAYVLVKEIYDGYPLKSKLEGKLHKNQQERDRVLDSLHLELESISLRIKQEKENKRLIANFQVKQKRLERLQHKFSEDAQYEIEDYKNQIWHQLNQYVKEYGDANGYDYIYSVDDSYYFLYHNPGKNITEDLQKFLSNKYKGVE